MAINYFGNTDIEKLILLIHGEFAKYVKIVSGKDLSTNDFTDAYKAIVDGIATTYAPLSSPALTGTPTAPTATSGDNSTQIATTAFVADAVSKVTGISFDGPYTSYEDMVAKVTTPKTGVIYLVSNGGTTPNVNDEYFWKASTSTFELFGTTAVDLSGYVKTTDLVEISASDVETKWNNIFS